MNALILIPCTHRKRIRPPAELLARNLCKGTATEVANLWTDRVTHAAESYGFSEIYCGRAFREAAQAVKLLSAEFAVISAGLGLVRYDSLIPSYSLTVAPGNQDSITKKVSCGRSNPAAWWEVLKASSKQIIGLDELVRETKPSLVLLSLSANYAKLVFNDLEKLSDDEAKGFRIFGLGITEHLPSNLAGSVMPYDARLNGPDSPSKGTMSDFGSRALHQFTKCLDQGSVQARNVDEDRAALLNMMHQWRSPETPKREPMRDDDVVRFILDNWDTTGGRSGVSLRLLRDNGYACDQGRFRDLFRSAREERERCAEGTM